MARLHHQEPSAHKAHRASGNTKPAIALLSTISHELRTPLNAILGFAQLLAEDTSLSTESLRRVRGIEKSGEHLLQLIGELLEVSVISSGEVQIHPCPIDLHALLREVVQLFEKEAASKGIQLRLRVSEDTPVRVITDPLKLRQILINLVGNAVKFTARGEVLMRAKGFESDDENCRLSVQVIDTGPGIRSEDAERVFQKFVRGKYSSSQEGSGLGLAICRDYARLLGGDVSLESTVGRGSVFAVNLPVIREQGPSPEVVTRGAPADQTEGGVSQALLSGMISAARAADLELLTDLALELNDEAKVNRLKELAKRYDYPAIHSLLSSWCVHEA